MGEARLACWRACEGLGESERAVRAFVRFVGIGLLGWPPLLDLLFIFYAFLLMYSPPRTASVYDSIPLPCTEPQYMYINKELSDASSSSVPSESVATEKNSLSEDERLAKAK